MDGPGTAARSNSGPTEDRHAPRRRTNARRARPDHPHPGGRRRHHPRRSRRVGRRVGQHLGRRGHLRPGRPRPRGRGRWCLRRWRPHHHQLCPLREQHLGHHGFHFPDRRGRDGLLGTADDDFTLSLASPCIDAGNADLLPPDWLDLDADGDTAEPLPVDARGRPRRVDVPGTTDALPGQSPAVDIGPVEYQLADCPADLAEPVGSLDAADALAFIDAFNAQDPAADLAVPFGTLNFFDIAAYIDRYNAGCP
ncbi:MAG: hypothetical protein D6692_12120 [Planctomycetota bacterium]|nr:MAG: hypothetical protein D6692_12120 [Planctomycetota bacterium]